MTGVLALARPALGGAGLRQRGLLVGENRGHALAEDLLDIAQVADDLGRAPRLGRRPARELGGASCAERGRDLIGRAGQPGHPLVGRLLEPRLHRGDGGARLGDELLEQARLPLVEALGVIGVAQPEQRVVEVVAHLVEQRPEIRAERDDAPLLGRAHPELDLRRLPALGRVEAV